MYVRGKTHIERVLDLFLDPEAEAARTKAKIRLYRASSSGLWRTCRRPG
jgi:hypothetical protein